MHSSWIKLQKKFFPTETPIELKRLSDTRWTSQIAACQAIKKRLVVLFKLLEDISEESNRKRSFEAKTIRQLLDIKFMYCLELFSHLLRVLKGVSDTVQKKQLHIGVAIDLIKSTVNELESTRSEEMSNTFYSNAQNTAEKHGLNCDITSKRKR